LAEFIAAGDASFQAGMTRAMLDSTQVGGFFLRQAALPAKSQLERCYP
jgi:hypothetical protein